MAGIRLDIVTAEQQVYSDEVDVIVAPGIEGELAILPHHTPLMTTLQPGELRVKQGGQEFSLGFSGSFLDRPATEVDSIRAEAALRRSLVRIKVGEKRMRRRRTEGQAGL